MNTISCSLRDELSVDFLRARVQLAEARLRQDAKDTSANRDAVVECWARIDAVLDMYLLDADLQKGTWGAMTNRALRMDANYYPPTGSAPEEAW